MTKTQVLLQRGCSRELGQAIERSGPIICTSEPAITVTLSLPPTLQAACGRVPLSRESVRQIERTLALSCDYDTEGTDGDSVRHQLNLVAIAFQLVKPTCSFLELWMQLDSDLLTEMVDRPVTDLGRDLGPEPYLQYQQHNCLTQSDVQRAVAFVPRLAKPLDRGHGSWEHPLISIHRALIFFCQGYSVTPRDFCQFCWAAGLDCLYASKLDRRKQGASEIGRRLQRVLGATLKLYEADTVSIPIHQKTRVHQELYKITADIFKLRNAFAHGSPIPDFRWLSDPRQPHESGYAYQLMEQTEIALRLSLLKILEDQVLFETFSDPARLDAYF